MNIVLNLFNDFATDIFRIVLQMLNQYGDYFRIWIGPELSIAIADPKDIEVGE